MTTLDKLFQALQVQCTKRESELSLLIEAEKRKIKLDITAKQIGQGAKYWEHLHSLEKRRDGMQLLRAALNDVIEGKERD